MSPVTPVRFETCRKSRERVGEDWGLSPLVRGIGEQRKTKERDFARAKLGRG